MLSLPNEAERAAYRAALQQRLQALTGEIQGDRDKIAGDTPDAQGVLDRKDQAEQSIRAGVDDAELARDLQEAREVRAALVRMGEGRFGLCVDCGDPIDRTRLAVQPAAARCAVCQRRAEQGAGWRKR